MSSPAPIISACTATSTRLNPTNLPSDGHPIRDRRGVGNLAQARLSLAPHQLAGKKDDEQRNHQRHDFLRIGQAVRQERDRARRRRNERHAHVLDLRVPLATTSAAAMSARAMAPQLVTIVWSDSRATASAWRM